MTLVRSGALAERFDDDRPAPAPLARLVRRRASRADRGPVHRGRRARTRRGARSHSTAAEHDLEGDLPRSTATGSTWRSSRCSRPSGSTCCGAASARCSRTLARGIRRACRGSDGRFVPLAPGRVLGGLPERRSSRAPGRPRAVAPLLDEVDAGRWLLFVHPGTARLPSRDAALVGGGRRLHGADAGGVVRVARPRAGSAGRTLRLVFAMLAGGGALPARATRASRGVDVRSTLDPNVYFDIATYGRRAIELCIETFGVEQLVYGSDMPGRRSCARPCAPSGVSAILCARSSSSDNPEKLLRVSRRIATWIADRRPGRHRAGPSTAARSCRCAIAAEELALARARPARRGQPLLHPALPRPDVDVWLICWTDRQDTGYHDHDRSSGARLRLPRACSSRTTSSATGTGGSARRRHRHDAGGSFHFDASYIHGVRHAGDAAATSIHVYSPALWRMGHYEPDEHGDHAARLDDLRRRAPRRAV